MPRVRGEGGEEEEEEEEEGLFKADAVKEGREGGWGGTDQLCPSACEAQGCVL